MKIAIIGAGGIGSYLIHFLQELIDKKQIDNSVKFTVFDGDEVEDTNLLYQNFTDEDLFENKASAVATKFRNFTAVPEYVTDPDTLKGFDLVVCCVDNAKARRLIYNLAYNNKRVNFIDLRSEGKTIAAFTKAGNTLKSMLKTLPEESNDEQSGSCQLASDKAAGTIQQGNKIIACMGSQIVLDIYRGESPKHRLVTRI